MNFAVILQNMRCTLFSPRFECELAKFEEKMNLMHFSWFAAQKTVLAVFGCENGHLCREQDISFMFQAMRTIYS